MRIDDVVAGAPLTAEEQATGDALGRLIIGLLSTTDEENVAVQDIIDRLPEGVPYVQSLLQLSVEDLERLLVHFEPHYRAFAAPKN